MTLYAGSTYAVDIESGPGSFPEGATYLGEVRRQASDAIPLTTITSAAGTVVRISDRILRIILLGEQTADWRHGEVLTALFRTDLPDPRLWTAIIAIPVAIPPTRRPS